MLSVATVDMHVEEALNGLLVDLFLQCSSDENLAAALETWCSEHGIQSDHRYQQWKLVNLFQKLKQRRILKDDKVDFLKQFAEAEQREDIKKRIEKLEEEKWPFPGNNKTKRSGGIDFGWPATLNYGSNALSQVLLRLVQDEEHMKNREKSAFYIYCDGLVKPQLDFSRYTRDPFLMMEQLMDQELIGPRNLDLLKRFFSLETVRKPKEIAILEHFEAGAFIKQALATYSGYSSDFTDEPLNIPSPWMETARLIKKLTKKSFKGTERLHFIRNLLQCIQQMESGEYRVHKLLNHLIEDVLLAGDNNHWQLFLKLLVVSGELCCLTDQPCFKIADISRAIGVRSSLDPKIILQTVSKNAMHLFAQCVLKSVNIFFGHLFTREKSQYSPLTANVTSALGTYL